MHNHMTAADVCDINIASQVTTVWRHINSIIIIIIIIYYVSKYNLEFIRTVDCLKTPRQNNSV